MSTINDLSVTTTVSSADQLPIWQTANGVTRRLPVSVLDGRYITQDQINLLQISPTPEIFSAGDGIVPNTFVPGTTFSLTLANLYGTGDNIDVFFDGTFQGSDQWRLTAFSLIFTSPIPVGTSKVYVKGGAARITNGLSNGSVTDASVATNTKLFNRINDEFNVKDPAFGAKGDGVTNDTVAIQAAITAAIPVNGSVYLPAGTYIVSSTLSAIANNHFITMRGAGMFSTTITTNNATADLLLFQMAGYELKDLQLSANVTKTGGSHFTTTSNQGYIHNVGINAALSGIGMQDSFCTMRKLTFTAPITNTVSVTINGAGAGMVIDDMTCYGGITGTAAAGIKVVNAGSLQIANSNIVGQGFDLWICPGTGQNVFSIYALNTFFDTAVEGVVIAPTGNSNVGRLRFEACWMSSHSQNGVFIQNNSTGAIGGVHFNDCEMNFSASGAGLAVNAGTGSLPTDIVIDGGAYSGNKYGAFLPALLSDFSITNANMGRGGGAGGNTSYGIVLAAGASNNYIIANNRLLGNGIVGLSDGGTGPNKSVTGNIQ